MKLMGAFGARSLLPTRDAHDFMRADEPGAADAQSAYTILPEGKTYEDKFVFGIYRGSEMVGCADLIRGYPDAATAYLGLLLVSEKHQGQGIGRLAFHLLEEFVRGWRTCDRIRVAVVRTNDSVIPFWKGLGFEPTGEIKPYRYGSVVESLGRLHMPTEPVGQIEHTDCLP